MGLVFKTGLSPTYGAEHRWVLCVSIDPGTGPAEMDNWPCSQLHNYTSHFNCLALDAVTCGNPDVENELGITFCISILLYKNSAFLKKKTRELLRLRIC